MLNHLVHPKNKGLSVKPNKLGREMGAERGQISGSTLRALFRINKEMQMIWKEALQTSCELVINYTPLKQM